MTDAIIEAYGTTLKEAYENAARGLVNIMFDIETVSQTTEVRVQASGHDLESLLFDWLEKVMLIVLTDYIVLSDFSINIQDNFQMQNRDLPLDNSDDNNRYTLSGIAKGEHVDVDKHKYKVEIKGITYHEMDIKYFNDRYTVKFLADL